MAEKNWFVINTESIEENEDLPPYRLYRFLTDLEDIVEQVHDDRLRLSLIYPLVFRLINLIQGTAKNF